MRKITYSNFVQFIKSSANTDWKKEESIQTHPEKKINIPYVYMLHEIKCTREDITIIVQTPILVHATIGKTFQVKIQPERESQKIILNDVQLLPDDSNKPLGEDTINQLLDEILPSFFKEIDSEFVINSLSVGLATAIAHVLDKHFEESK